MPNPEKEAFDEYAELGVELPEEAKPQDVPEETPEEEPEAPAEEETPEEEPEAVEEEDDDEEDEPLQPESQTEKPKKRSIYHDLKSAKNDAKTEKELRLQAEQERDELLEKLQTQSDASTPAEQAAADSDLEAFAEEIGADPKALAKMKEFFLKDVPQAEIPEGLEDFQAWQKENSAAIEEASFEKEFVSAKVELERLFPKATAEEHEAIKGELKKLAHTEEFHDKELGYIAFKQQSKLSNLVSPKKPGLEQKGRADADEKADYKFDPNADLSNMSAAEAEKWEAAYQKASSNPEGLQTDSLGRSILV